jgi:hypothetical protein
MLDAWLRPIALATFRATYLRRAPLARPGTAYAAQALLDWSIVDRVLASGAAAPHALVVARGRELPVAVPRSMPELRALMAGGGGLCLRYVERCDDGLAGLAASFEAALGTAHVQVFVTPGGTHGFGWHYDDEDVFIAQVAGAKDYYFRPNTVAADLPAHPRAFGRFQAETSVLHTATLVAGDFLYVPARWWHMALCVKDALSISVGVVPRAGAAEAVGASAPTAGPRIPGP